MEFLLWVLAGMAIATVLVNSITFLRPGQAVEEYEVDRHIATYYPRDFKKGLSRLQRTKFLRLRRKRFAGWFGIVFCFWPFRQMVKFPTSEVNVKLFASKLFSKRTTLSPQTKLGADPKMEFRFLTIRGLIAVMGRPKARNLLKECKIERGHVKYDGSHLAFFVLQQIEDVLLESLRKAGAMLVWDLDPSELQNDNEMTQSKKFWEIATFNELAAPESSLVQARILQESDIPEELDVNDLIKRLKEKKKDYYYGDQVLSVDIIVGNLDLASVLVTDSPAQNAVNTAYIKKQEAAGILSTGNATAEVVRQTGYAEADGIGAKLVKQAEGATALQDSLTNVDPEVIAALILLKDSQQLQFTQIAPSIIEGVKALAGPKPPTPI